jgi:hypothetical protein
LPGVATGNIIEGGGGADGGIAVLGKLAAATTYTASLYLYRVDANSQKFRTFIAAPAASTVIGEVLMPPNEPGKWVRLSWTFTTTEAGAYRLQVDTASGSGVGKAYVTAVLVEQTASLNEYFPTPAQLTSGEAGWSGTAHQSASDIGPFARGTARTFVMMAKRDTQNTADGILRTDNGTTGPRLYLAAEPNQDLAVWEADTSGDNESFTPTGITAGEPFLLALTMDEAANLAKLYVDGQLIGTAEETDPYNAPGTLRLGEVGGGPFDGSMLPFAVFTGVLSDAEVAYLSAALADVVVTRPPDSTESASLVRSEDPDELALSREPELYESIAIIAEP